MVKLSSVRYVIKVYTASFFVSFMALSSPSRRMLFISSFATLAKGTRHPEHITVANVSSYMML